MKKKFIMPIVAIVMFIAGAGATEIIRSLKSSTSNDRTNITNDQKIENTQNGTQESVTPVVDEPKLIKFYDDTNRYTTLGSAEAAKRLNLESDKLTQYLVDLLDERFDAESAKCAYSVTIHSVYGNYAMLAVNGKSVPSAEYASVEEENICSMHYDKYIAGPNVEGVMEKLASTGTHAPVACSDITSIGLPKEFEKEIIDKVQCIEA